MSQHNDVEAELRALMHEKASSVSFDAAAMTASVTAAAAAPYGITGVVRHMARNASTSGTFAAGVVGVVSAAAVVVIGANALNGGPDPAQIASPPAIEESSTQANQPQDTSAAAGSVGDTTVGRAWQSGASLPGSDEPGTGLPLPGSSTDVPTPGSPGTTLPEPSSSGAESSTAPSPSSTMRPTTPVPTTPVPTTPVPTTPVPTTQWPTEPTTTVPTTQWPTHTSPEPTLPTPTGTCSIRHWPRELPCPPIHTHTHIPPRPGKVNSAPLRLSSGQQSTSPLPYIGSLLQGTDGAGAN